MPGRRKPREVKELVDLAELPPDATDGSDGERERAEPRPVYHATILDLPPDQRPRERLRDFGEGALNDEELLAIILRVGIKGLNARELGQLLLVQNGGLTGLARLHFHDLGAVKGVGEAKAAQLKAAFELGFRAKNREPNQRAAIGSPADVWRLLGGEMALLDQEQLRVLVLNTKNQVLASPMISQGTVNQSQVRPSEVFRPAVRLNATSIIVVHNHPSGDPTPSRDDVSITRELVSAGRLLDIEVLDHIVIGQGRHVSLKDLGQGF